MSTVQAARVWVRLECQTLESGIKIVTGLKVFDELALAMTKELDISPERYRRDGWRWSGDLFTLDIDANARTFYAIDKKGYTIIGDEPISMSYIVAELPATGGEIKK